MTTETVEEPTTEPTQDASTASDAPSGEKPAWRNEVTNRLLLPFLLPVLSTALVVLLAVNVSRLFLAGDHTTSLIAVIVLTVALLVGFAAVSAARNMRNATSAVLLGAVVCFLLLAGGLTYSQGAPSEEGAAKPGQVPADFAGTITPLTVDALPTLKFDKSTYDVPAGALDIKYVNVGGQHTLVFSDARFSWFELAVNAPGDVDDGKIQLAAGTYEIYCSVPGHKAAGMVADLVVAPGA
jgi:plastocyanin